jgi:hypothetical protein
VYRWRIVDRLALSDVLIGGRLLRNLPKFLHRRITLEEARAVLRRRRETRQHDFLDLVRRAVYENAKSPYRPLLQAAGCEYGDLQDLVVRDGVEGALRVLHRHGVGLTVDEFKGRRPVVRGPLSFEVDPARCRNPWSALHVPARTSGSRSGGTPVLIDLAFIRDCAVDTLLSLDARGGGDWEKAHWQVPGGGAIARLVEYSSFGAPSVRWFSQVDPTEGGLPSRYRWSARVLRWAGLLAGRPFPRPLHVPLDDPLPIARWMHGVLASGGTPHLFTFASSAVRLCQTAIGSGLDLKGAQFTVVGEPLTGVRLDIIRQSGAEAVPRFAAIESSVIGHGCLAPDAPDEVHLLDDLHAVVQPDAIGAADGARGRPLLLSSIRPTAPFVLLNVSLGDRAVMTTRDCGCQLERLGWARHLHTIRSDEKLTAGGMTFLDSDVIRVMEEVLPSRFGGAPTDYQLLDAEDGDGHPRLSLLVHPSIGPVDPRRVVETFLAAIGQPGGAERIMSQVWRDGQLVRVERRPPLASPSGKILHLHTVSSAAPGTRSRPLPTELDGRARGGGR